MIGTPYSMVWAEQGESVPDKTSFQQGMAGRGLVRPRQGRIVAGVLVGLAQRFGVSPTVVRLLFILSMLLPGPQVLAYIALWILMPSE
jgi:phage shock protein PspC (stress-responsive transcriptional regulator)